MSFQQPIGQPVPRTDGVEKVTGATRYTADLSPMPGMLWAKALRSPHAHARITRIDVTRAEELSGVHAVLTGADVSGILVGRQVLDMPVIAETVVRYVGERVAVVAAESVDIANAALELIEVTYEELPAVFDATQAMAAGAPLLHPALNSYVGLPEPLPEPSNLHIRKTWEHGDIDAAFAAADLVVEGTYETARMHQAYLEPHACIVWLDEAGRAHVIASNKAPYRVRRDLARSLDIEPGALLFHPVPLGGDFGGKAPVMDIPVAYLLAKRTGRPVKMVMTYAEELAAAGPRHSSRITMRTALRFTGEILGHRATVVFNSGAYAGNRQSGIGDLPASRGAVGPYRIPATRIDVAYVYTNLTPGGFMRAPGGTQTTFAFESHMDAIARRLGMDPAEYRLQHLVRDGDAMPLGAEFRDIRGAETLQAALDAARYSTPKPPNTGRGVAVADRTAGPGRTQAGVRFNASGTIEAFTSIFEQGAGTYTALQQIAAGTLGVPMEMVRVQVWDTDGATFDTGVGASRSMRLASPAMHRAATEAREKLLSVAAEVLGWPSSSTTLDRTDVVRGDTGERQPWASLLARTGAPVEAIVENQEQGEPSHTSFTAQVAEVAVDPETGQVRLVRFTTAQDTGVIINPLGHRGQVLGSVIQGIGQALSEELVLDSGRVTNGSFLDYKIPAAPDVPEIRDVLLRSEVGTGPLNVREIGEGPLGPVAAAIANAIEDATGQRVRQLPLRAEDVLRMLRGG